MKRVLAVAMVASVTLGLAVPSSPVRAAALGQIIWDGMTAMPDSYPAAMVGDSFEFDNSNGPIVMLVNASGTIKEQGGQTCTPHSCYVNQMSAIWFDVLGLGTVEVQSANGTVLETITLGAGAGGATGPATVVKASFDPNGGTCIFDGTKSSSKYDSFTIGFSYAPGTDECARPQCVHVGWNVSSSASTPMPGNLPLLKVDGVQAKRSFVAKSGDYVADWVQAPKFDNITLKANTFTELTWDSGCRGPVRFDASGPCLVNTGRSVTVSGQVLIIAGDQAGSCAVTATPVFTAYQNLDGTLPLSTPPPTLPSSTFTVTVEVPPSERSIAIIGSRGTADVSLPSDATCRSYAEGPPPRTLPVGCVVVEGIATGYPAGTPVTPEYRFPGQTSYTAGIDVTINDDGEFTWYRKTGKKIYVRFLIGDVVSSRVIIPAK